MLSSNAAIWSAIAAFFAAVSSFLIMLIQRRNLLDSVRPELVLTSWERRPKGQGDTTNEVIAFKTLKNVGRGAALHISLHASHKVANKPVVILPTIRLSILAANEEIDVNGKIAIWWENVTPNETDQKHLFIKVRLNCLDSRGMRHETYYNLFADESSQDHGGAESIAPGVSLTNRTTVTRPVWWLKVLEKIARIPLLGRLFHKEVRD